MPIALENGFYQSHDLGRGTRVGIETVRLNACLDFIKTHGVSGLFGAPSFGFQGADLDFLTEISWIEDVWFWDINLKRIDGLYALENLKCFGVHPKRPAIDFSCFEKLQSMVIELRPKDCGIGALKELQVLHLWHFRPEDRSFSSLGLSESITELQINWANPDSLETLPDLPQLKRLEVHRCRNLRSLGNLGQKFPNLEYLIVEGCGQVACSDGEGLVRNLPKLVHANVQNTKLV
jgi:hypothetical protein